MKKLTVCAAFVVAFVVPSAASAEPPEGCGCCGASATHRTGRVLSPERNGTVSPYFVHFRSAVVCARPTPAGALAGPVRTAQVQVPPACASWT